MTTPKFTASISSLTHSGPLSKGTAGATLADVPGPPSALHLLLTPGPELSATLLVLTPAPCWTGQNQEEHQAVLF